MMVICLEAMLNFYQVMTEPKKRTFVNYSTALTGIGQQLTWEKLSDRRSAQSQLGTQKLLARIRTLPHASARQQEQLPPHFEQGK